MTQKPATMVTALVNGIRQGWSSAEVYRLAISGIGRHFRHADEAARRQLLDTRPELTGTDWDAVLAAVVEHVAALHGYPAPAWVNERERFWIPPAAIRMGPGRTSAMMMTGLACSPGAFIRHGIIGAPRDLDERGGELVLWSESR